MYSMLKPSFLLLLAMRLSCSQGNNNECPAPTDIYPCTCSSSSLGLSVECYDRSSSGNTISLEDIQDALETLYEKKINYLGFSYVNMEQAPSELLNGLAVEKLKFLFTYLRKMPTFEGSENTLEDLTFNLAISRRVMKNFSLKLSHLKKLKSFTFEKNYFSASGHVRTIFVGNDWFEDGPFSLETVKFNSNKATSLGDRVFLNLLNLKEIDLSWNKIEEVHRSMFPYPAERLLSIDLQRNQIKSLPEDIFSHMPVLTQVDIYSNPISVLDESTWRPVWEQLDILSFGDHNSPIICDSTMSWTLEVKRPKQLNGRCGRTDESNEEYRGRDLAKIIDEKQGLPSNGN